MKTDESILRDVLRLVVWFPLRWCVRILPVGMSFSLFRAMGSVHFALARHRRKSLLAKIRTQLGTDSIRMDVVKDLFKVHYIDRLHIFLYPKLKTAASIEKYVSYKNVEMLEKLQKEGKGVLIVQSHFGPVQITLLALALRGYDPIQIGYPTDKGLSKIGKGVAYKYRMKYESMLPAPIISADGYLGSAYKQLKNGGVVFSTGDGAGGDTYLGEHKEMDFFKIKRLFPTGPASWALKTGATMVPTFIVPEGKRFSIIFEEPIDTGDGNKSPEEIMTEYKNIAEQYVRKYPYCWHFWDEI